MKFNGLKYLKLLETKNNEYIQAKNDNVRTLIVDSDETSWMRYKTFTNKQNPNADDYLPTRLYVQKAVAQIVKEIYQNQKWLVVPISAWYIWSYLRFCF